MRHNVYDKLEFNKVLKHVAGYAITENGKAILLNSRVLDSLEAIKTQGDYVTEAKEILIKNDIPPLEYLTSLNEVISKSTIEGAVLKSKEILEVLKLAETSRKLHQFLKRDEDFNLIRNSFTENLMVDKVFENHISKVFTDTGDIRDKATAELARIRKDINSKNDQLHKAVNRVLKQLSQSYLVQEEYVTQRDGRIVVPVKAEHKRHVKGFIHSESATGQTVYIEPEETLELNNDILSLGFAEKREIDKILRNLTKLTGGKSYELKLSFRAISEVDAIFAKAKYSMEIIGSFPSIELNKPFEIIKGRHPILVKKLGRDKTIPLDLKIDKDNVILITGPNAGGKTVVLKTVGLLTLLVNTGFHIPADPDSNFHHINKILLDIGDEQSIEDDLSTFSSHLSNIKAILEAADEKSLILLDEVGTGTDPAEGSALASAILLKMKDLKAKVLATTHHGNLKIAANDIEGFQNASMEFDTENLAPTYVFNQGIPGSSYAFEVAKRLGYDDEFLNVAKEHLDTNKTKIEEFLLQLEEKSQNLQMKLNDLERENSRLKGLANLYENKVKQLEKQKKDILNKTKEEADQYLKDVNKQIETAIKNIRETKADKEIIKEERKKIEKIKVDHQQLAKKVEETEEVINKPFEVGDSVKVKNTVTEGVIDELDKAKGKAMIIAGSIKLQVKLSQLEHVKAKKKETVSWAPDASYNKYTPQVQSYRLDIRGKKPEEVDYELIRYLDEAYAANMQKVEILHGKGTGVLKQTVHDILKHNDNVKDYYFAKVEFGGDGITIVELN